MKFNLESIFTKYKKCIVTFLNFKHTNEHTSQRHIKHRIYTTSSSKK